MSSRFGNVDHSLLAKPSNDAPPGVGSRATSGGRLHIANRRWVNGHPIVRILLGAALIDGEAGAYGVTVPDLPGCTSGGSTTDEALRHTVEAARLWAEDAVAGKELPPPRSAEILRADPEMHRRLRTVRRSRSAARCGAPRQGESATRSSNPRYE
jgi:predicted RNase H-like HicB family nuclease